MTFNSNFSAMLVLNFKTIPSASPKLLNLNQKHPSKKLFFLSNPSEIEIMITSVIEMLYLPNFAQMTTLTIQFESRDKILLVTSWTEILTSLTLLQKTFSLRKPRVAIFADVIKTANILIKKTF